MEKAPLDKNFWNQLWLEGDTGWDIGYPSPALVVHLDAIENKATRILIPGAGNAYEAEYLHQQGFTEVFVLDISPEAQAKFKARVPDFPREHLICGDFFEHTATYDLILEQTFFCALDPSLRPAYVAQMGKLLNPGGRLAGLLFNEHREKEGPPFGGDAAEYRSLFKGTLDILKMEPCTTSIKPREGRELFFVAKKA